jgi:hypothetical protein
MQPCDLKAFYRRNIESARDLYAKDLEIMSEEALSRRPTPSARSAYDYTYEVVQMNHRMHCRLTGGVPPKDDSEGWVVAPEDWQNKERMRAEYVASMDKVVAAWEALPDEEVGRASGEHRPTSIVHMCCIHAMYHDAQLNYLQALDGDLAVHW